VNCVDLFPLIHDHTARRRQLLVRGRERLAVSLFPLRCGIPVRAPTSPLWAPGIDAVTATQKPARTATSWPGRHTQSPPPPEGFISPMAWAN
jgi:hypothetical protein